MVLLENVLQVPHRSVSTAAAQRPFLLIVGDLGAVNRPQLSVDPSTLGMESIAERLANNPWPHLHHGTLTARNPWWHPRNRWLDTSSTSDLSGDRGLVPPGPVCHSKIRPGYHFAILSVTSQQPCKLQPIPTAGCISPARRPCWNAPNSDRYQPTRDITTGRSTGHPTVPTPGFRTSRTFVRSRG